MFDSSQHNHIHDPTLQFIHLVFKEYVLRNSMFAADPELYTLHLAFSLNHKQEEDADGQILRHIHVSILKPCPHGMHTRTQAPSVCAPVVSDSSRGVAAVAL